MSVRYVHHTAFFFFVFAFFPSPRVIEHLGEFVLSVDPSFLNHYQRLSISMSSPTQTKGTALVTGAAQGVYHCLHDPVIDSDLFLVGIGRAIALRLAADGFDVAINDIASKAAQLDGVKDEIIAAGRRSAVFGGDVSVDADVKAMVAGVVEALGGLDVVSATPLFYFDC